MILLAVFLPPFIAIIFANFKKTKNNTKQTTKGIVVCLPKTVSHIGTILILTLTSCILCFTFLSKETPHWIFYLIFGLFIWLETFLIVKTLTFKVVLYKREITVYPILNKPYSFLLDEIVSATRQVKNNRVKSERIVIKTNSNKLIVENIGISYKRFKQNLESELNDTVKFGF